MEQQTTPPTILPVGILALHASHRPDLEATSVTMGTRRTPKVTLEARRLPKVTLGTRSPLMDYVSLRMYITDGYVLTNVGNLQHVPC